MYILYNKTEVLSRQFGKTFYVLIGCGGRIRTCDLKLMRLPGTARLPYSAVFVPHYLSYYTPCAIASYLVSSVGFELTLFLVPNEVP